MKYKIRILKGAAADFFDHCGEVAKEKGPGEPFADDDIIEIDIDNDLFKFSVEVFEDDRKAMLWFISPNYALGGRRPGELPKTPDGR